MFSLREQVSSLRTQLTNDRLRIRALQGSLDVLEEDVATAERRLPPNVPALVSKIQDSIVTVHVGGGVGSGFAVDLDKSPGYCSVVVTAAHVVEAATFIGGPGISVSQGGSVYDAELFNWDFRNDLALIDVAECLQPLPWAVDSGHQPRVGEFVAAVGSPFGLEGTTTVGIISKLYEDLVQTDAAMNPGNSGGPLINRFGEVVGVNSFKLSGENVNFASRIENACAYLVRC